VLFYLFNSSAFFYKYWELALRLRGLIPPPIEVFYSSPFYICYVALLQGMSLNYLNVQILQVFFGALNCWLIYRAGSLFFTRSVGIIASCMAVFYGPFIIYNSSFLPAVLVITLNLISIICLGNYIRERRSGWLIGAGLFIGLSIIARPNSGIFLVLVLLYFLFYGLRISELVAATRFAGRNIAPRKTRGGYSLTWIALILIPTALVVLPIAGFNYLRSGEFIPVTASGGWVFYCGNNERAKGFDFSPPLELTERLTAYYAQPGNEELSYLEHLLSREIAQERVGGRWSHRGGSMFWFNEGVTFIRKHPGSYLKLLGKKVLYSINGYEPHDVPEVMAWADLLKPYPLLGLGALLPLALLGLIIARPRIGGMILYLYLTSYLISFLLIYIIPRFRLPMVPVLLLFAAAAVKKLYDDIHSKQWKTLIRNILILVPLAILVNISTPDIQRDREIARPAFLHEWKGMTYMKRGKWKKSEEEFTKALKLNPQSYQARRGLELAGQGLRNGDDGDGLSHPVKSDQDK